MNTILFIHSALHNSLPSCSNHQKVFVVSVIIDDCIWLEGGLWNELHTPQGFLDAYSIEELLIRCTYCVFHEGLGQKQSEEAKLAVHQHHQTDLHKLIDYKPWYVQVSYSGQKLQRYVPRGTPNTICHAGIPHTTSIQSWQRLAGGMRYLLGSFGRGFFMSALQFPRNNEKYFQTNYLLVF